MCGLMHYLVTLYCEHFNLDMLARVHSIIQWHLGGACLLMCTLWSAENLSGRLVAVYHHNEKCLGIFIRDHRKIGNIGPLDDLVALNVQPYIIQYPITYSNYNLYIIQYPIIYSNYNLSPWPLLLAIIWLNLYFLTIKKIIRAARMFLHLK
jgi:hypothetical protein